ncbi:MAG: SAM-dependent methyltransferase [Lachnospiraceae bacterium]|nr:SAM-dependent methyltransferase [Lachnospiraceae bacterium]
MIRLTARLQAVADLVPDCDTFTDIGTDHGYLPIYLLSNNICKRAVAADLRRGPLDNARKNAEKYMIEKDRIEFVLSDGLERTAPIENGFNVLSITGMGGEGISSILLKDKSKAVKYSLYLFSPHTKLPGFRRFLVQNGYSIKGEKHLVDDGKLYVIIKAVIKETARDEAFDDIYYEFGPSIKEAVKDSKVREIYLRRYRDIRRLVSDNKNLPQDKRQELMQKALQYKEVLGIEA